MAPIDSFSLAQGPEPVEGLPLEGATQAPKIERADKLFALSALSGGTRFIYFFSGTFFIPVSGI